MAIELSQNVYNMPYVKVRRGYGFAEEPYKSVGT